jgi:hypothetical protein
MSDDDLIFRLAEDCQAFVWHDPLGWCACLLGTDLGESNFVGPYNTRQSAVDGITAEFVMLEHALDE